MKKTLLSRNRGGAGARGRRRLGGHPRRREGARHAQVRRQHRLPGLRVPGRGRASGRASTSPSAAPSPRRCSATREGRVRADRPARRASPRSPRARSTCWSRNSTWTFTRDVDLKLHLRRRQLLRRPGLHGVEGPRRHLGHRARRRDGLRPDRHHHRAEPRRLLQGERHQLPAGADPDPGRGRPAVPRRRLRRLHHRRLAARHPARGPTRTPTTTSSCRRSSPRSRSARWCARATTSGRTSCAGRSTRSSPPRSTA